MNMVPVWAAWASAAIGFVAGTASGLLIGHGAASEGKTVTVPFTACGASSVGPFTIETGPRGPVARGDTTPETSGCTP